MAGFLAALLLSASACLPTVPPEDFVSGVVSLPVADGLPGAEGAGDPPAVELQYLGVAGWRIQTPRTVLLAAPLLSNPGLLEVGVGGALRADTARILEALEAWDVGPLTETAAILVGHGHYDHLLDVPWIAARLAPRARILAPRTSAFQLRAFRSTLGLGPERVEEVGSEAASPQAMGRWIRISDDVRVLPVRSDHAPHFAGHVLYDGERRQPLNRPPGPAHEWLAGETLAFLIDVLDPQGGVALRIYYQDAIPREPGGLLPGPALMGDSAAVDLALLVPASYAEVQWHPEAVVGNVAPRRVLVHHWEDFFQPPQAPPESLAFTLLPDFLGRLERVMGCKRCIYVPVPGTRFRVMPQYSR